jgi:hypothetical protein
VLKKEATRSTTKSPYRKSIPLRWKTLSTPSVHPAHLSFDLSSSRKIRSMSSAELCHLLLKVTDSSRSHVYISLYAYFNVTLVSYIRELDADVCIHNGRCSRTDRCHAVGSRSGETATSLSR